MSQIIVGRGKAEVRNMWSEAFLLTVLGVYTFSAWRRRKMPTSFGAGARRLAVSVRRVEKNYFGPERQMPRSIEVSYRLAGLAHGL